MIQSQELATECVSKGLASRCCSQRPSDGSKAAKRRFKSQIFLDFFSIFHDLYQDHNSLQIMAVGSPRFEKHQSLSTKARTKFGQSVLATHCQIDTPGPSDAGKGLSR